MLSKITEWEGPTGLFPIDDVFEEWFEYKVTEAALLNGLNNALTPKRTPHQRGDTLFSNAISKDTKYAK